MRVRAVLLAIERRGVTRQVVMRLPHRRDVRLRGLARGRAHALCCCAICARKQAQRGQRQRAAARGGDPVHDVPPVRTDPSPRATRAGGSARLNGRAYRGAHLTQMR